MRALARSLRDIDGMTPSPIPPLAEFLRWIAEMPAAFRGEPGKGGGVRVRAVVADLMETVAGEAPGGPALAPFATTGSVQDRNRLRWVLAACHLLWHPSLRGRRIPATALLKFLVQDLAAVAAVANADGLATEEERREELTRRALGAAGLRLPGETKDTAETRLNQVDSIERRRLIATAAEKQRRARALQEELRRKAAEEAASKASSE